MIVSVASMDIFEVPDPLSPFGISSRKRMVATANTGRLQTTSETQAFDTNRFQFTWFTMKSRGTYLDTRHN
jgi:hypothetical protein